VHRCHTCLYEKGEPFGLTFYVRFPAEPDKGQPHSKRVHGSYLAGPKVKGYFVPGKCRPIATASSSCQLLAPAVPLSTYVSLAERLRGCRVVLVLQIDVSSSTAVLCTGLSRCAGFGADFPDFCDDPLGFRLPPCLSSSGGHSGQWVRHPRRASRTCGRASVSPLRNEHRRVGLLGKLGSKQVCALHRPYRQIGIDPLPRRPP
jgi:hypothetical protein